MLLIIAHHYDVEAIWLYRILQQQNKLSVTLLIPEALGIDFDITMYLCNNGHHHSTIHFYENDDKVESKTISYVINRLAYIDPIVWKNSLPKEKAYTTNEMNAFFSAFIHSLTCPVSNKIYNGSLCGEAAFTSKWASYFLEQQLHVHIVLFEPIQTFYDLLSTTNNENIFRCMLLGKQLIVPTGQKVKLHFNKWKKSILQKEKQEMLEYIFIEKAGQLQLAHISKTPVLSMYGQILIDSIHKQINTTNHDIVDGNTQRNTPAFVG